jgi:hypothetical protein
LKRKPFLAQTQAILGIAKRWEEVRSGAVVTECGTGKTLVSLGSVFSHARGRRFTALALSRARWSKSGAERPTSRFLVYACWCGVRNGVGSHGLTGVNEVRLRNGRIVREGIKTTLSDMRLSQSYRSARARWDAQVNAPTLLLVSKERGKIGALLAPCVRHAPERTLRGKRGQSRHGTSPDRR